MQYWNIPKVDENYKGGYKRSEYVTQTFIRFVVVEVNNSETS